MTDLEGVQAQHRGHRVKSTREQQGAHEGSQPYLGRLAIDSENLVRDLSAGTSGDTNTRIISFNGHLVYALMYPLELEATPESIAWAEQVAALFRRRGAIPVSAPVNPTSVRQIPATRDRPGYFQTILSMPYSDELDTLLADREVIDSSLQADMKPGPGILIARTRSADIANSIADATDHFFAGRIVELDVPQVCYAM